MPKLLAITVLGLMAGNLFGESNPPPWRADRILIKPKVGQAPALAGFHARHGLQVRKAFPDLEGLQVLQLPRGTSLDDLLNKYTASGLVEFAERDYLVRATVLAPNDPRYTDGTLWNLNNTGAVGGTADADIDAPEGWAILNSASNIVVAVIDSGVRITHEDLAANIWINPREIPGNGVDDDRNGLVDDLYGLNAVGSNSTNVLDDLGHGTHIAGIIGGVGNNGLGIAGVAWQVKIMACKFMDATGNGYISDAIESFDYARTNGAKVINASFASTNYSSALYSAINACRSAGIIVVAAAGNDGLNNDAYEYYPANYGVVYGLDNIVAVAATDRYDQLAYFSNYGSNNVHVATPGYGIYSTYNNADNGYTYLSGTSMATPHVVGLLALMRARYPIENYQQIIRRMMESVDQLPSLAGKCRSRGRVNLAKALGNYQILFTNYNWITLTNAATLSLSNDGVSSALALPFIFNFYGRNYSQFYVGANGLLGFINQGLGIAANTDFSSTNAPYAVLCPFWDDLNPANAGTVTFGTNGTAPNRQIVVTWTGVPRANSSSTKLTFQAVLEESTQRVLFQYLEAQPNKVTSGGGARSATIGLRGHEGALAARFTVNGAPFTLTNKEAIVFVPLTTEALELAPAASLIASGNTGGPFAPSNQNYVLTNVGNTTVNWSATKSQNWLSLSATNGALAVGQSSDVTVALNPEANLLPAGNYFAIVTFLNVANSNAVATRAVSLTVVGTNAALVVTPAGGLNASGYTGGPFNPTIVLYTLINTGDTATAWTATKSQSWITLSSTNGVLAPGANIAVAAFLNTNANVLPAGTFNDTVEFRNLTTGNGNTSRALTLQINERPGILAATPVIGLDVAGITGGPFAPTSMVYTLTNVGTGPLNWTATKRQPWLDLSPTNGILAPGQSIAVMAGINTSAEALAPDTYYDTVELVNTTTGAGNTMRAINLLVHPKPGRLLVLPETNSLVLTGLVGGPIAFTNQIFQLTNAGGSNLFWTAAFDQEWLNVSPADGALLPGESTNILVGLTTNVLTLPVGSYTNTLVIIKVNGTNDHREIPFLLDLAPQPPTNAALAVTPETGLNASGLSGGPFSPTGMVFTLINTGDLAMSWTISNSQPWMALSSTNGVLDPGARIEVTTVITTNAETLPAGVFTDTLAFRNLTTGNGDTDRPVILQVNERLGILEIMPLTGLEAVGIAGGPFSPNTLTLTLTNTGTGPLEWAVSNTQPWLEVSATTGALAAGLSTTVIVSFNTNALMLLPGRYSDIVEIMNTTAGTNRTTLPISLLVHPKPGRLLVLPETNSLTFTGYVGGPILFTNFTLLLTNAGGSNLDWTAVVSNDWLQIQPTNGALTAGESTNLLLALGTNVYSLPAGLYTNALTIAPLNDSPAVRTIPVILEIRALPKLAVTAVSGQGFQLHLVGEAGQLYVLEYSTDLFDWFPFSLNTADTNGTITIPEAAGTPRKYFRAKFSP